MGGGDQRVLEEDIHEHLTRWSAQKDVPEGIAIFSGMGTISVVASLLFWKDPEPPNPALLLLVGKAPQWGYKAKVVFICHLAACYGSVAPAMAQPQPRSRISHPKYLDLDWNLLHNPCP